MSPLAFDAGGVKEFSLVKDPSFCCFGAVPQMNHWIHVVMLDKQRTEFYSFDPIALYGVLEVGERYEDGYVVSLYRNGRGPGRRRLVRRRVRGPRAQNSSFPVTFGPARGP